MKKNFTLLFIFCSLLAQAQNWQCLQSGVKHYFINGNGYLRGIRIDSVKTVGDSTVYYPFHTPRGGSAYPFVFPPYFSTLDSNGGSWLGKSVVDRNGTFIFDSYWGDSLIIKSWAVPGESWVLYKDSSTRYYKATVTAIDTMTISGSIDSIKTIIITAHDTSGIITVDPVDSFNLLLSKNNGFVQVCDLFTFPYHMSDTTWRPGLDFYLDRSSCAYSAVGATPGNVPAANVSLFRMINFINPNEIQLHNWNVGDTLIGSHYFMTSPPFGGFGPATYITEGVTAKIPAAHAVTYTLSGLHYSCAYMDPCLLIVNAGTRTFYDYVYPIADTTLMPEETHWGFHYLYYFPVDSSYCEVGPSYTDVPMGLPLGPGGAPTIYKLGIGRVYSNDNDETDLIWGEDKLVYYKLGTVYCGFFTDNVHTLNLGDSIADVYPNPATDEITIKMNNAQPVTVSLINMMGQTIKTQMSDKQEITMAVDKVPAGIYTVIITNDNRERINTKVVINH